LAGLVGGFYAGVSKTTGGIGLVPFESNVIIMGQIFLDFCKKSLKSLAGNILADQMGTAVEYHVMEDAQIPNFRTVVEWCRPDSSVNPPAGTRLSLYRQLKTKYFVMVERDARHKRFPLQFRQAFREFQSAITQASQWVWSEVAEEVDYMRRFAVTLHSHYKKMRSASQRTEGANEPEKKIRMAPVWESDGRNCALRGRVQSSGAIHDYLFRLWEILPAERARGTRCSVLPPKDSSEPAAPILQHSQALVTA
jgi:hypothetical protein